MTTNGVYCGRRVAILWGAGRYFACRQCHDLAYPSTRQDAADRNAAKLIALRERLGGPRGLSQPWPEKPKGMRLDRAHMAHFEARIARSTAWLRLRYAEMGLPWEGH